MALTIPAEYVQATRLTEQEILLEISIMLFQKEKLTLAQAATLCGMPQHKFQWLLGVRDIVIHYDIAEFVEDIQTIKQFQA